MRSFIQYKAGVTFYKDSEVSLAIRKNYIEYVFSLGMMQFGVINLMIYDDQLIFIAECGDLFQKLFKEMRHYYHSQSKMPLLTSLLKGNNTDYFIGTAENQAGRIMASFAILHMEPNIFENIQPITIAAHPQMMNTAHKLLLFAREVFNEMENSEDPGIKQLISSFEMI